jgi:hypothetical protein
MNTTNLSSLSTAELRKLEHEPDLAKRQAAWRELYSRWEQTTPTPIVPGIAREAHRFGLPWIGCA